MLSENEFTAMKGQLNLQRTIDHMIIYGETTPESGQQINEKG